ncbi:MAG: DUF1036 domain-containing protein [Proteobacteria bacterium]|nr:DUF1036 domain-containing protein [Pseudomonadota bacterium]
MSRIAPVLFRIAVLAGFATPAAAGLSVCNQTAYPAAVALGAYDGAEWGSQGWWTVGGGDCMEILSGPLIARYYYLYAVHREVGGAWNGNRSFCVGQGQFQVVGRGDCVARGFDNKRFFQIDTGGGNCLDTLWGGMSGSGAYYIDGASRFVHAVASTSNRNDVGRYRN